MDQGRDHRRRIDWATLAVMAVASLAFANAARYISYAGIPFVISDGWYFVDAFLQKYYQGGVTLQDLYMKRSADDHAQPLHKLLLIWNADTFGLDFVIESYIGLALGAVAWLLMVYSARQDNLARATSHWWTLAMVAAAFSLVSLSGGMVFNWSLVTLAYFGPLVMVGLAMASWEALERARWWPLLVVAPLVIFTMDGTALICSLSVTGAVVLRELKRRGSSWQKTGIVIAILVATVIAYRLVSHLYLHPPFAAPSSGPSGASTLLGLGWSRLAQMTLDIAALTVADPAALKLFVPDNAVLLHKLLGAMVIAAHLWFWWRAVRDRWSRTQFIAVTVMLFCYGAAAGIVLGRVPLFGPEYVFQQRYLLMYQMGTVALALMAAGGDWTAWRLPQRLIVALMLLAVIAVQWPLSRATWMEAPYVQAYGNKLGRQMVLLGLNPDVKLVDCVPMLVICQADRAQQVRSIELLKRRRLNAFSPDVIERHSLQSLRQDPGPAEVVPAPAS